MTSQVSLQSHEVQNIEEKKKWWSNKSWEIVLFRHDIRHDINLIRVQKKHQHALRENNMNERADYERIEVASCRQKKYVS
jgi:hypothetical protein